MRYWHALHLNACCHGGPVNHLLLGRTSPKGLLLPLVLCQTTPLSHSRSRDRFCARQHHCHIPGAETGAQEQRHILCQMTPLPHSRSRQVLCQMTPLPHSRSPDRFCARWHHCHIPEAETGSVPDDTTATFQEPRQVPCHTTPLPHSRSRDRERTDGPSEKSQVTSLDVWLPGEMEKTGLPVKSSVGSQLGTHVHVPWWTNEPQAFLH